MTNNQHEPVEKIFKVIVVGEIDTGKTCLIRKYVHNIFHINTKSTIGVDFAVKTVNYDSDTIVTLQLWDIAGQERYGNLTRVYYQAAGAAMVVYSVDRRDSFDAVLKWKKDIDNKVFLPDGSPIPCILIANKCDLDALPRRTTQELNEFCERYGFVGWFETSAKTNHGVQPAFKKLIEELVKNDHDDDTAAPETVVIARRGEQSAKDRKKKMCC